MKKLIILATMILGLGTTAFARGGHRPSKPHRPHRPPVVVRPHRPVHRPPVVVRPRPIVPSLTIGPGGVSVNLPLVSTKPHRPHRPVHRPHRY